MLNRLDAYDLQARVAPVIITILPIIICINLLAPQSLKMLFGTGSAVITIILSIGAISFGRHFGASKQAKLWDSWGGPSTTRFLRHSDTQFNSIRRERCHRNLQKLLPDIKIPSLEEEMNDSVYADKIYEACTKYLIGKTKDKKLFPLIFKENVNYGFLRNIWGLKTIGILLSTTGSLLPIIYTIYKWQTAEAIPLESIVATSINLIILLLWIFWVKPTTIKVAADAYAERLLEFAEQYNCDTHAK